MTRHHEHMAALHMLYGPSPPKNDDIPTRQGEAVTSTKFKGGELRGHGISGTATTRILDRLERVRKAGKGWSARCPAHADRTASLSLAEGSDGRCVLHCFAGCDALSVVHAIGLELADLYPDRLSPTTPEQRRELREFARMANWKAALAILTFEATIVEIAAKELLAGQPLIDADTARLSQAVERIADARAVLV